MNALLWIFLIAHVASGSVSGNFGVRFPSGQSSAEGVACDLARSFAARDADAFEKISFKPKPTSESSRDYLEIIETISKAIRSDRVAGIQRDDAPESIEKCFKARGFSRSGPASYGYAAFGLKEVMFVDIVVRLRNGQSSIVRTLVVQKPDGKWYVIPTPDAFPLLSSGLSAEEPSTVAAPN
jgi:hypothetical protein